MPPCQIDDSADVREATVDDWDVLWPLYQDCWLPETGTPPPDEKYSRRLFVAALHHGHKAFMTDRGFMHVESVPWAHAPGGTLVIHHAGGADMIPIGRRVLSYAQEIGASVVSYLGCVNHGAWLEDLGFVAHAPVWRKSV